MRLTRFYRPISLARLAPLAAAVLLAGCASVSPSTPSTPSPALAPTATSAAAAPTPMPSTAVTLSTTPIPTVAPTAAPSAVACRDWRAWHDSTPGKEPTLFVVGTCDLPTPGHAVSLRRKAPQGINPRDLLLEKVVTSPSGAVAQAITAVEVRYEEKTDLKYDTVTVLPDGATVRVDETS